MASFSAGPAATKEGNNATGQAPGQKLSVWRAHCLCWLWADRLHQSMLHHTPASNTSCVCKCSKVVMKYTHSPSLGRAATLSRSEPASTTASSIWLGCPCMQHTCKKVRKAAESCSCSATSFSGDRTEQRCDYVSYEILPRSSQASCISACFVALTSCAAHTACCGTVTCGTDWLQDTLSVSACLQPVQAKYGSFAR
jgi:hypothetical protein